MPLPSWWGENSRTAVLCHPYFVFVVVLGRVVEDLWPCLYSQEDSTEFGSLPGKLRECVGMQMVALWWADAARSTWHAGHVWLPRCGLLLHRHALQLFLFSFFLLFALVAIRLGCFTYQSALLCGIALQFQSRRFSKLKAKSGLGIDSQNPTSSNWLGWCSPSNLFN